MLAYFVRSVHLKKKEYACPDCDFKGAQKCDLNRHFKHVHLKDKRYVCRICLFRTNMRQMFSRHLEVKHQAEVDRKLWQILKCDENLRDEEKLLIPRYDGNTDKYLYTYQGLY